MSDPEPPRVITDLQAFDAMILYLKTHAERMGSSEIHMLYEWAAYQNLERNGYPLSPDPREYDEWRACVEQVVEHPEPFPRRHPTMG